MATNETTDKNDKVIVMPSACVGSAVTLGLAEEWLLDDGGATGGVAYDNKHTTDLTDSNRDVTIGNGGEVPETMLKDLPDDKLTLEMPGLVEIAEDVPATMAVTGVAPLVAPMESFSKILKSLGLIQCKTDPCLFYLFDRYGNLQAIVVACCDDCIVVFTGHEKWWVTKLKTGISGGMTMPEGISDILYDPQNTEDVKMYCATSAAQDVSSNTVSSGHYSNNDSTPVSSICSGDHGSVDGWTVIQVKAKAKKTKEAPHRRKTEESIIGVNGIHKVVNGNAIAADGIGV
ncbi:hypothetical protein MHU86_9493 [Fragilaria crotonensis]|nr:hypothetical protein MHU86_9493 [Fragilaria crotonensis]